MNLEEFPYHDKQLVAIVSGGVDSALLLYYLLISKRKVNVYTTASEKTLYKNAVTAANVVRKCMEITNNYQVNHIISYQPNGSIEWIFKPLVPLLNNNTYDSVYTGITANPPEGTIPFESGQEKERDPTVIKNVKPNPYVIQPFINHDKKWIAEMYKKHNLMETLFPVTRSCEHQADQPNDPGFDHCGKCWWCKEREWAFNV
jgi:7-cyano-7-deazaguanine synthase in queuosine biosynthesis